VSNDFLSQKALAVTYSAKGDSGLRRAAFSGVRGATFAAFPALNHPNTSKGFIL